MTVPSLALCRVPYTSRRPTARAVCASGFLAQALGPVGTARRVSGPIYRIPAGLYLRPAAHPENLAS
jgi:hypothetical protein